MLVRLKILNIKKTTLSDSAVIDPGALVQGPSHQKISNPLVFEFFILS